MEGSRPLSMGSKVDQDEPHPELPSLPKAPNETEPSHQKSPESNSRWGVFGGSGGAPPGVYENP